MPASLSALVEDDCAVAQRVASICGVAVPLVMHLKALVQVIDGPKLPAPLFLLTPVSKVNFVPLQEDFMAGLLENY